ncbi:MAG: peptidase [Acidimicrobiia bacterium]|nr:peptidase [Acidimicrobiia bacterium]
MQRRSTTATSIASPSPLDLVRLRPLMALTAGSPFIGIGLIDGPVATGLEQFGGNVRSIGDATVSCAVADSAACRHGTLVASILGADRSSPAPGIAPHCTLISRPIFGEDEGQPAADPNEVAAAVVDCVQAGVRVLNISASLLHVAAGGLSRLDTAVRYAAGRGVLTVVAAGNQATIGGSALARSPWVIPVMGCDRRGRPLAESNVGAGIGRRGLQAPAEAIIGLAPDGGTDAMTGTSAAAPFVTGAIALMWSLYPQATAGDMLAALVRPRRPMLIPPLLDASNAYDALRSRFLRR